MTKIWLVNWHFQLRITLWCRHKSTNVFMRLCWQMPKFIVWRLWSIYFDHHLPLKPSIGKRRKQSCTSNNYALQESPKCHVKEFFVIFNFLFKNILFEEIVRFVRILILYIRSYVNIFIYYKRREKKYIINTLTYFWGFHRYFLYKDYAFCRFSPYPDLFLECQRCVQFTSSERVVESDTELFLRAVLFIFRCLLEWWRRGKKRIVGGKER